MSEKEQEPQADCTQVAPSGAWRTVNDHGMPRYEPGVKYIGINSAGYACCFNFAEPGGECWNHTGEEHIMMMSGLRWWRVLDLPASVATWRCPDCCGVGGGCTTCGGTGSCGAWMCPECGPVTTCHGASPCPVGAPGRCLKGQPK